MRGRRAAAVVALVATAAVVVVLMTAVGGASSGSSRSPIIGHQAPALAGTTLSGASFRLRPSPGTTTVVNIWASWCGPCRNELPMLATAATRWARHGVRLVTVNTRDGPVAARTLLKEVGARHLLTVQDPQGRLAVTWGATGVPETFVVDQGGVVRARWVGQLRQGWLDSQLHRWSAQ
ncbi:MAG TPA: redoxin domain-containing protein [Nocardioidaceae bacterium]|nr:redoxin domain-containing protein [Nocardioidaceae bacterium]